MGKRKVTLLRFLVVAFIIGILLPDFGWTAEGQKVTSNAYRVRIRSEASLSGDILGYLAKGEPVTVIARTSETVKMDGREDYWYKIANAQGVTGWVFGSFLQGITKTDVSEISPGQKSQWENSVQESIDHLNGNGPAAQRLAALNLARSPAKMAGPALKNCLARTQDPSVQAATLAALTVLDDQQMAKETALVLLRLGLDDLRTAQLLGYYRHYQQALKWKPQPYLSQALAKPLARLKAPDKMTAERWLMVLGTLKPTPFLQDLDKILVLKESCEAGQDRNQNCRALAQKTLEVYSQHPQDPTLLKLLPEILSDMENVASAQSLDLTPLRNAVQTQ